MTNEQFDALVARLSREAAARPLWYQTRVLLLAMLGYAYVFGILMVLLAIVGGVVYVVSTGRGLRLLDNVAIPLLLLAWVVSKSLWVRIDPPDGRQLRKDEAPRLFAAIDDVCRKLRAPRADVVLVNDEYNAGVSQIPRLGAFGWHRNYLVIGLPMMHGMPPDEWLGVLAHEFSHLSRAHARFGNWIYRVRKTWYQLMDRLENERQGRGVWLFKRFFHWYAPYFGAYSFVLARQNEFEADKLAATVAGKAPMARGFITTGVRTRLLSHVFWPKIKGEVITSAAPPRDVQSRMAQALRSEVPSASMQSWIEDELAVETGSTDTHPSTRDRIAALGVTIEEAAGDGESPAAPIRVTAADHFLGDLATTLTAQLDADWHGGASSWWRERHARERGAEERLAELEHRRESLDDGELWELADLTDSRRGPEAAEPLLREVLTRYPRHAAAAYSLGYNLLQQGEEEGVGLIERAIEVDRNAAAPGCRTIAAFLRREGRTAEAEEYEARAHTADIVKEESAHERDAVYRTDTFLPHEIDGAVVASIVTLLAARSRVKRAWIARKALKHRTEDPVFVLGFDTGFDWRIIPRALGIRLATPRDPLVDDLANNVPFPGEGFVVNLHANNAWLKKKLKKVPGAAVYQRPRVSRVSMVSRVSR